MPQFSDVVIESSIRVYNTYYIFMQTYIYAYITQKLLHPTLEEHTRQSQNGVHHKRIASIDLPISQVSIILVTPRCIADDSLISSPSLMVCISSMIDTR